MSKLSKLMPRVIQLLEHDAASYNLSARLGVTESPSYAKNMRTKERERRLMVKRITAALKA